jgi:hypothetical protein
MKGLRQIANQAKRDEMPLPLQVCSGNTCGMASRVHGFALKTWKLLEKTAF